MKLLILEDDPDFAARLRVSLRGISDVELVGVAASVAAGIDFLRSYQIDLVLMDVELSDGTAFDILEQIDKPEFQIIFVTSHDHYALRAIKFCAIDYVLKPLSDEELHAAIDKVRKARSNAIQSAGVLKSNLEAPLKHKRIGLNTMDAVHFIEPGEIVRCQARGNYTEFFLVNTGKILTSTALGVYAELLQDYQFLRVHRSHLINLNHVRKFVKSNGGMVVMSDNTEIGVSKNIKNELIRCLSVV